MQKFRNFVRGPVGVTILVLFIIPFVASAFYGYFTGGNDQTPVATVGGREIPLALLEGRVRQMREQMRQQSPQLDAALVDSFVRPSLVLQGLVNNELMILEARDAGMGVTGDQAAEVVVQAPQFHENGKYSSERFAQFTRNQGMTPSGFIKSLQMDMLMYQLRAGIAETGFALPFELREQRRLAEQQRDIRYVLRSVSDVAEGIDVDATAVEQYYADHADRFTRPEQFRVAYVELDPSRFSDEVTVSDEEIAREYEARRAAMETVAGSGNADRRAAAHIQIRAGETRSLEEARIVAAEVARRLEAGEDFAAVAREVSEDPSTARDGGVLGELGPDDLPEALGEALFALGEGQVSAPIEVEGNLHILKVLDVRRREIPTLDAMREAIRRDLHRGKVDALLAQKAARLEELAYEQPDLQVPAAEVGVEVQRSDWFSLDEPSGVAADPQVAAALRTPAVREDGLNSDLLQRPDGSYVVVRLDETRPPEPIPLDQVREQIVQTIRLELARARLAEQARELEEGLAQGTPFEELARKVGKVREAEGVTRQAGEPAAAVVAAAFSVPRPVKGAAPVDVTRLPNGDLLLLQVRDVRDGALAGLDPAQEAMALAELAAVEGERSLGQVIGLLREQTEIEIDEARLAALDAPMAE